MEKKYTFIGFKIINLARLEGGSCIEIPRRPITQSKLIILKPIAISYACLRGRREEQFPVRLFCSEGFYNSPLISWLLCFYSNLSS